MSGLSLPFLQLHGQNTLTTTPFLLTFVPLLFLTGAFLPLLVALLMAVAVNIVFQCAFNRLATVSAREAVLVTGAGVGLGEATALRLAKAGYTVFAAVRRSEDGEALQRRAGSASHRVLPLLMDMLQQQSVDAAVATVQKQLESGGLVFRALINNVGPMTVTGALEAVTVQSVQDSYALLASGTLRVTQAFLPLLHATAARGGRARLVFTTSISGSVLSVPFYAVHSANKAAIEQLANAFRMELHGFGIEVSIVTPGSMDNVERKNRDLAKLIPSMEQLVAAHPGVSRSVLGVYDRQLRGMFSSMKTMGAEPVGNAAVAHEWILRAWLPEARYFCSWDGTMASAVLARLPHQLLDRMLMNMTKAK